MIKSLIYYLAYKMRFITWTIILQIYYKAWIIGSDRNV